MKVVMFVFMNSAFPSCKKGCYQKQALGRGLGSRSAFIGFYTYLVKLFNANLGAHLHMLP